VALNDHAEKRYLSLFLRSESLMGKHIEFPGLQLTITDVLVPYTMLDGREGTAVVHPAQPWLEIAAGAARPVSLSGVE
jgi:hypothetical protein